jgi:hypothetical protein
LSRPRLQHPVVDWEHDDQRKWNDGDDRGSADKPDRIAAQEAANHAGDRASTASATCMTVARL